MVSVIIPTFNRADMVGNAIQSVLDQTYDNWELIVVDDGSTDYTADVVAGFQDARIRYIYQENRKLPGARNSGIRASSGQYVAFLDSDDRFLPHKLEEQVAVLKDEPNVGLVASGWIEVDLNTKTRRSVYPWRLQPGLQLSDWLGSCPFIPSAILIRRDWLMRVDLFDEQQHFVEDWDLWLRLSYAGCEMRWQPTIVCEYFIHEANMVYLAKQMTAGRLQVLDKFISDIDPSALRKLNINEAYAHAHLDAGVRLLGADQSSEARRHLKMAVKQNPTLLQGRPPAIFITMASAARTYLVKDTEEFVRRLCDMLPAIDQTLKRTEREIWAMIWADAAFAEIASEGSELAARRYAVHALLKDPKWISNRGLLKILLN